MSSATEAIVQKIAVLAALAGLGSAIAFLLVACGSGSASPASAPRPSHWHVLPSAPQAFDQGPAPVWTGGELILFGRRNKTALDSRGASYIVRSYDVAEAYDPASRTWTRLSPPPGPGYVPVYHAVWTGKELLAFSAFHSVAYNPTTHTWRNLRRSVGGGLVVWTGREAIGWGGGCCGDAWGNGLAYNPSTDTYRHLAPSPLAPSQGPIGAWTGKELVLYSTGFNPASGKPYPARLARAAAYNPATDTWRRIAPLPGIGGTAAWDGREVLVVGNGSSGRAAFAYDPAANRRRRLAAMPFGLNAPVAFWAGDRLLVWGDSESGRGLAYDPRADRWSVLRAGPLHGSVSALAWTGRTVLVANGVHTAAFTPLG